MNPKFSHEQAESVLTRLDKVAATIQENAKKWGMDFKVAKELVNTLDKIADEVEQAAFGVESFTVRQAEVLQVDKDEKYMKTFENPMAPVQTEKDEKYMAAYKDDQSSAVQHGKTTTGRPLVA